MSHLLAQADDIFHLEMCIIKKYYSEETQMQKRKEGKQYPGSENWKEQI